MTRSWAASLACAGMVVASGHVSRVAAAEEDPEAHASRAQAVSAIAAMERSSDRVRTLLRRARASSRESTIACVSAGLSQVDVTVRAARDRNVAMSQAYARGESAVARRELAQITWQKGHVHAIVSSTESCVDARFAYANEGTTVTVSVDRALPPEAQ